MTLIKSISSIPVHLLGGTPEDRLNPLAIVKFVATCYLHQKNTTVTTNKIVVGRDAASQDRWLNRVVLGTLTGMGFDVVDIDLATTPTTELAIAMEGACERYYID